jgi:hypothetical protein
MFEMKCLSENFSAGIEFHKSIPEALPKDVALQGQVGALDDHDSAGDTLCLENGSFLLRGAQP